MILGKVQAERKSEKGWGLAILLIIGTIALSSGSNEATYVPAENNDAGVDNTADDVKIITNSTTTSTTTFAASTATTTR